MDEPSPLNTDAQFLADLRAGKDEAMNQFVKSELPRVYNLCLRLCKNQSEAEDLSQDVFLKALRAITSFHGQSKLSTWLYTIALNTWKNNVRSDMRRHRSKHVSIFETVGNSNDNDEEPTIQIAETAAGPDQVLEIKEISGTVFLALDQLDPDNRGVIVLRDIEHLSYEEIAKIQGIPVGTVKSRLSRARDDVRTILKRMGI